MARVRSLNRSTKQVGEAINGGQLGVIFQVTGWHVEMDESVNWKAYCTTYGDRPVRFVCCKPFTFGPWQIIMRYDAAKDNPQVHQWHPDNEDWFFFPEYQNEAGQWVPCPGEEGHADAVLTNGNNACNLSWFSPNHMILTLEAQ